MLPKHMVDLPKITIFQKTVLDYYQKQGRHDLPWRQPETDGHFDPYKIMVSEIMLQQTQVPRVIPKFLAFTQRFGTVASLAQAPLSEVLKLWSGLGYNRRAKFLWQAARQIADEHAGELPSSKPVLITLPGIGVNTAGAITVYAHDRPEVFIETNIRTVFIHHFCADRQDVSDKQIAELVAAALPANDYRTWYWALMDYGTYLKQSVGNVSRQSKTFVKQSRFQGSKRQIRGQVLRLLGEGSHTKAQLVKHIADERLDAVLQDLTSEGLITRSGSAYSLPM